MIHHDEVPPVEIISAKLLQLFGVDSVSGMQLLSGGHLCKNFVLETSEGKFFLKQYRHKVSQMVHQIKHAEQYFADRGIPVVLPVKDSYGRAAFYVDNNWYSLFPYYPNPQRQARDVTENMLKILGGFLARIHKAGKGVGEEFQSILLWDKERFLLEATELEICLKQQPVLSRIEQQISSVLAIKRKFVETNTHDVFSFQLPNDTLLHCDFSYQNVFFSEDNSRIEAVFDFEKSARGPRAFEVARSMFVCCFDDSWEQKNIDQAVIFLAAYLQKQPLTLDEFVRGVKMYLIHLAHQTWVESKVLLKNSISYVDLLDAHERRIKHLGDDLDSFATEIYKRALDIVQNPS